VRRRRDPAGADPAGPQDEFVNGAVVLRRGQALELTALGLATLYSFLIPLKGNVGLLDTAILVSLFAVYAWATARAPAEDPHLVGPAATIGGLPRGLRRAATYAMFAYAAAVIIASAEPFAEGLVDSGTALGVDEFLLVQWLAPFASEAPEFLVALLFAWRGLAGAGLRTLVASKVNQWTLLIGTLAVAYSLALGRPAGLPLDERQMEELFLTSAQSLFALALIANFDLSVRESVILLGTFLLQLFFPGQEVRLVMGAAYVVVAVAMIGASAQRRAMLLQLPAMVREAVNPSKARPDGSAGD
jgi:cation:H+ antiporter